MSVKPVEYVVQTKHTSVKVKLASGAYRWQIIKNDGHIYASGFHTPERAIALAEHFCEEMDKACQMRAEAQRIENLARELLSKAEKS